MKAAEDVNFMGFFFNSSAELLCMEDNLTGVEDDVKINLWLLNGKILNCLEAKTLGKADNVIF